MFLARPRGWRNQVWETDHIQVPVLADVDGKPRRPWITWFADCATNAVTPAHPSRESVLAALRSAVVLEEPYRPVRRLVAGLAFGENGVRDLRLCGVSGDDGLFDQVSVPAEQVSRQEAGPSSSPVSPSAAR
ncbi:hypothetical protein ACIQPS_33535 [Streptomyces sp. NPDC091290]|uniref:hypothetical protein n=1 Tax=Streptomyces sp. NPDC091290 TaxID=3365990 RepID=UPI0037F36A2D